MKELLIFPYNGNGLEALDCIGTQYRFIGFVDDVEEKQGVQKNGVAVYSRAAIKDYPDAYVLAVPGSPASFKKRREIIDSLNLSPDRFATVIHPSANISPLAEIGINTLIMAGVVLTANCRIGNNVCILPNTVIHHDSEVGAYTLVGSNVTIAGYSTIGENCYIGSGSSIINNIRIGKHSLIGMGSNVIRNLEEEKIYAGNPAKAIIR